MKKKNNSLNWTRETDENSNPTWIANGPLNDGGIVFQWIIREGLFNGCVEYYCESDYELVGEKFGGVWHSLSAAQNQIQKWNDELVKNKKLNSIGDKLTKEAQKLGFYSQSKNYLIRS